MENYEPLLIRVIEFDSKDILTTSGCPVQEECYDKGQPF